MKVVFWGRRAAEFQFGRVISGWFQAFLFLPLYLKAYAFDWYVWAVFIIGFILVTWFSGFVAYRMGFVKSFRKKEFEGIL